MTREYPLKSYGAWAGDPKGQPYDPACCAKEVWPPGRAIVAHQCQRKRVPGSLFCKQHDPDAEARRREEMLRRQQASMDKMLRPGRMLSAYRQALRDIMKGVHPESAREVARAALKEWGDDT